MFKASSAEGLQITIAYFGADRNSCGQAAYLPSVQFLAGHPRDFRIVQGSLVSPAFTPGFHQTGLTGM